ncbi:MAG: ABC transporter ATP-binding protein [Betaproteobacteria bacterium]|nr:ABC transporter ATP-binding protein [Betaproteobacteria bacterium]
MIRFQHTRKHYDGAAAITDLNLDIQQGELVVLLGPSGSGKSTVLKMVNRMVSHDAGHIFFKGKDINSFNVQDLRRRMGYAIQSVGLFPHRTVTHNIATVPKLLGWNAQRVQARVNELLTLLAMDPEQYASRYPHQLSGGQQQRVGVARALAADPDVLLMDEPFGALDPVTRAALQIALKNIHRATGKTILFVTHDIDEALLLATRIVLLNHGHIAQAGTPLELLQQPANDFVADFLGRADLGLKQLSLRSIASHIKAIEGTEPKHTIAHTTTFREAISHMATLHVSTLSVVNESGTVLGQVQAADLLEN